MQNMLYLFLFIWYKLSTVSFAVPLDTLFIPYTILSWNPISFHKYREYSTYKMWKWPLYSSRNLFWNVPYDSLLTRAILPLCTWKNLISLNYNLCKCGAWFGGKGTKESNEISTTPQLKSLSVHRWFIIQMGASN